MFDGRKRIAGVLVTLCIAAASTSTLGAAPTFAKPDIHSVQSRVDTLYAQAETASERYNQAKTDLRKAQVQLKALRADLTRQQDKVESVREQVASAVVAQYQGQALSSTAQVLLSQNPTSFLDQLSSVSQYNDQRAQMMADFAVQAKQLQMRQQAAEREVAQIAKTKQQLGRTRQRSTRRRPRRRPC